ncbi:hypothetical protein Lnau_0297 [Legionella nautarum]|uniref:Uncharacterized protein n=1 Tax=Legionella nautarum TaxID=45070 RepID=A0A0W0X3J4_9GAMM|nr:hypothetical protein [Legionella nautarum]KTD39098.1 hypothetical protein Lnau_0297 [Legionella nautarum]
MYKKEELLAFENKFKQLFDNNCYILPNFPTQLAQMLTSLREQIEERSDTEETRLDNAAVPLLIRLYLLSIGIMDLNSPYSDEKRIKVADGIIRCTNLIKILLAQPADQEIFEQLDELLYSDIFELRAYDSAWKHYFFSTLDKILNAINRVRTFVFSMNYPRSRLATREIIGKTLEDFLLVAENPSTTSKLLSSLRPQIASLSFSSTEENKAYTLYLSELITSTYEKFYTRNAQEEKALIAARTMLESLNRFGQQVLLTKDNLIINNYAETAFLASQDLAIELLKDESPSIERMEQLTTCFDQAAIVIQNPGKKAELKKLELLVEKSDYKRYHCDKEKSTYAIFRILISALFLAYAIYDVVTGFGVSLAAQLWVISAEAGSLAVGSGQLYYFSNGKVKNTLFADSLGKLTQAARIKSYSEDWQDKENLENRREEILIELNESKFGQANQKINNLLDELACLRTNINKTKMTLISSQARAVLQSGEELAIDLLRAKSPSSIRIKKLRKCIEAANTVVTQPDNLEAIHRLVTLISERDYEARKIIARDFFIASLLALASVALYVVTITGTVLSAGITAGTIFTPITLSITAAYKFAHAFHSQHTRFTDEAEALTEFAQIAGKNLTLIPVVAESPMTVDEVDSTVPPILN